MNSNWKKNEDATGVLTVVLEGEDWAKDQKKAFNKLKASLDLKGFRKGQIPDVIARQRIGEDYILEYAVNAAANNLLAQGVEAHDIDLIASPTLHIAELTPEKAVLEFTCQVKPDVVLSDYNSLGVEKEAVEVTEEDIQNEVDNLRNRFADWVIRDENEPAQLNDQVTIDFVGYKDGEPFQGGSAQNQELVLGSGTFIPGFEEQLVGILPEEERDVNVTFPENYPAEELAGAPVVFKVKAHDVKYKELPEFDDELAARLKREDVDTAQKFLDDAENRLRANKERQAQTKLADDITKALLDTCVVVVPEVMIEEELQNMKNNVMGQLKAQYGIKDLTFDQYAAAMGKDADSLLESWKQQAEDNVKARLILEAIATAENLVPTDEEVDQEYTVISQMYQMPAEQIKRVLPASAIKEDLMTQNAMRYLSEKAE